MDAKDIQANSHRHRLWHVLEKTAGIIVSVVLAASLLGCASLGYRSDSATEIHPGHVGHEIHN